MLPADMLSEQTVALGAGWEPMNVQLDAAEPQSERGTQDEGPWRTSPRPLEHLQCGLEDESLSLQEKGKSTGGLGNTRSLIVSAHKVALKIPNLARCGCSHL